ncbi:TetR/AcrR family transcriptional regulator [Duganella dendranthematis]|jgi:AcrR family transcriptional regulator|uniref:TetR/AcrR family transcriptional regulator n=1 Tax=Duganella dendranthematis TaxID=2728021 RepID=A0ABX6M389_9BURK|nr:TetR/AcrR family transcriptional regulator [Duganella dendranthematis]QJD88764.1 TetR/AcrR family transcriptional regulator [Duganella dendranthematis]
MPAQPAALSLRKAPRQRRAAYTVDAILEAAALVLEEAGLAGFNTNAVARRAGASIGTLYQYFPSKDALTLALLMREEAKAHAAAAAAAALPSWREALTAFIDVGVAQQLTRPNLARLLDQEEGRPEIRAAMEGQHSFHDLLLIVLDKPDTPTHLQDDARRSVAAADLFVIIRGLVDAAGQRGERDVEDLARRVRAAAFGVLGG